MQFGDDDDAEQRDDDDVEVEEMDYARLLDDTQG